MNNARDLIGIDSREPFLPEAPTPTDGDYRWVLCQSGIALEVWRGGQWQEGEYIEVQGRRKRIYSCDCGISTCSLNRAVDYAKHSAGAKGADLSDQSPAELETRVTVTHFRGNRR